MRRIAVEPMSRLAPASRWLAWTAAALAVLSVIGVRFGGVPPLNGLATFGAALAAAVLALTAAGGAMLTVWRFGGPGFGLAFKAGVLAILVLGPAAWFGALALRYPALNDVTTDVVEAPSFGRSRAAVDGRRGLIPREYDGAAAQEQQDAYPDVRPILLEQLPDEAMALVLKAATNLGWQIHDSTAPAGRLGVGRVEATARSLVFGFADDITIRIRPGVNETRIDMRSTSRLGRHDFGVNARRILAFQSEIETLAAQK